MYDWISGNVLDLILCNMTWLYQNSWQHSKSWQHSTWSSRWPVAPPPPPMGTGRLLDIMSWIAQCSVHYQSMLYKYFTRGCHQQNAHAAGSRIGLNQNIWESNIVINKPNKLTSSSAWQKTKYDLNPFPGLCAGWLFYQSYLFVRSFFDFCCILLTCENYTEALPFSPLLKWKHWHTKLFHFLHRALA